MSKTKPRNLIVRKRFLVPVRSSVLQESILAWITQQEPLMVKENMRNSYFTYTRNGFFRWDYQTMFAITFLVGKNLLLTEEKIERIRKELEKGDIKRNDLTSVAVDTPFEILYTVYSENVEGCLCEVAGYPLLYGLSERLVAELNEAEIQNILFSCGGRLVKIFVSARAKFLSEELDSSITVWALSTKNTADTIIIFFYSHYMSRYDEIH